MKVMTTHFWLNDRKGKYHQLNADQTKTLCGLRIFIPTGSGINGYRITQRKAIDYRYEPCANCEAAAKRANRVP